MSWFNYFYENLLAHFHGALGTTAPPERRGYDRKKHPSWYKLINILWVVNESIQQVSPWTRKSLVKHNFNL